MYNVLSDSERNILSAWLSIVGYSLGRRNVDDILGRLKPILLIKIMRAIVEVSTPTARKHRLTSVNGHFPAVVDGLAA